MKKATEGGTHNTADTNSPDVGIHSTNDAIQMWECWASDLVEHDKPSSIRLDSHHCPSC